jgi:hypothetical protein
MNAKFALVPALRRALVGLVALVLVSPVQAGTPLICHPYAIGNAKSLPGGADWHGVSKQYDRQNLVPDTLALLSPETPLIVRMETLRRAAIYATSEMRNWDKDAYTAADRAVASALFEKLRDRSKDAKGPARALALFDAGFFVETLRHARMDLGVDGYELLTQAIQVRGRDAEMEFALALASSWPRPRPAHRDHLARARAGAKDGSLLATNLASHFSRS